MSKQHILLTAFGKDRPGIVAEVTRILYEKGGNIEDSTMTRLGGEFAMMLVVSIPPRAAVPALKRAFQKMEKRLGLSISMKAIPPSALRRDSEEGMVPVLISVYGTDKPGIIFRVAQALAVRHINITDLNTKKVPGDPKPLYVMILEAQAPPPTTPESLQKSLSPVAQELGVEITVQDLEPVAL